MATYEGKLDGKGLKVGIAVSRFNDLVTKELLGGALDRLHRLGVAEKDVSVAWVPGAFELPRAVHALGASKKFHGVLALAAVVRGATPHFEYVAAEAAKGLAQLNLDLPVPVAFGVLTADTMDQALERAGSKGGNKGWDAALGAIETARLAGTLARTGKRPRK